MGKAASYVCDNPGLLMQGIRNVYTFNLNYLKYELFNATGS